MHLLLSVSINSKRSIKTCRNGRPTWAGRSKSFSLIGTDRRPGLPVPDDINNPLFIYDQDELFSMFITTPIRANSRSTNVMSRHSLLGFRYYVVHILRFLGPRQDLSWLFLPFGSGLRFSVDFLLSFLQLYRSSRWRSEDLLLLQHPHWLLPQAIHRFSYLSSWIFEDWPAHHSRSPTPDGFSVYKALHREVDTLDLV